MSVDTVSQNQSLQVFYSRSTASVAASPNANCGGASSSAPSTSVSISKPADLFSELSSLAQSDPDKFKALAGQIAAALKSAAQGAPSQHANALNNLADKFSNAAQTSDASGLAPQHRAHHHHGGHKHGGETSATSETSASTRAADAYKQNDPSSANDPLKAAFDSMLEMMQATIDPDPSKATSGS